MPLLSDTAIEKFRVLCNVQLAEGRRLLDVNIGRINADCAKRGLVHSGARLLMLDEAFAVAVADRAIQIWRDIVRVHRTYGNENAGGAAAEFKSLFEDTLQQTFAELDAKLREAQTLGGHNRFAMDAFQRALPHQLEKHFVEIDLYCEDSARSAMATDKQAPQSYNFYGTVGAVQTGANAVSNIAQSIGADEKERLKQALREVQAELTAAGTPAAAREDLDQVIEDSVTELDQPSTTVS
ncbi:hypothetical protein [Paraburkholderia tagetis]|uniref:Uncharacterized protein n=1 Tax=Paraburkholderia tagetis TaxID=2913261 RepID=A0A9X1UHH3_9BURK|nr:hypothetical protein [Paraburkholderia tagetis]MCG5076629.1 hypothetical protein [Paraburkholderia tagetis]